MGRQGETWRWPEKGERSKAAAEKLLPLQAWVSLSLLLHTTRVTRNGMRQMGAMIMARSTSSGGSDKVVCTKEQLAKWIR